MHTYMYMYLLVYLVIFFRVNKDGAPGASDYTASLQKHMTPYVTTQASTFLMHVKEQDLISNTWRNIFYVLCTLVYWVFCLSRTGKGCFTSHAREEKVSRALLSGNDWHSPADVELV